MDLKGGILLTDSELWGPGPEDEPYGPGDYKILNEYYRAYSETHPERDSQTELAIRFNCRARLKQEKCLLCGDIKGAQNLESIISSKEESELLRKKDGPKTGAVFIDDIVAAVEREGWSIMSCDELLEAMAKKVISVKYDITKDAAEQALLAIYNTCAVNEGRNETAALPREMHLTDEYGQFIPEQDEAEKQIFRQMKISREEP